MRVTGTVAHEARAPGLAQKRGGRGNRAKKGEEAAGREGREGDGAAIEAGR